MAYAFDEDKSKVEVVNYPSKLNGDNHNFALSSNVFHRTLTKTTKNGFFFVTFDALPQGVTGTVDVYLDDSNHQIANVPLNTYTKTVMGFVPIKEGQTLCCKFFSNSDTATVYVLIYDVV